MSRSGRHVYFPMHSISKTFLSSCHSCASSPPCRTDASAVLSTVRAAQPSPESVFERLVLGEMAVLELSSPGLPRPDANPPCVCADVPILDCPVATRVSCVQLCSRGTLPGFTCVPRTHHGFVPMWRCDTPLCGHSGSLCHPKAPRSREGLREPRGPTAKEQVLWVFMGNSQTPNPLSPAL